MVNVNPVIAKISLDASEFKRELEAVEKQLTTFKSNFRSQGGMGLDNKEVKKMVEEYTQGMNKVKEVNKEIEKQNPWKEQVERFKIYEGQIRNLQSLIKDFKGFEGKEELSVYSKKLNEFEAKLREIKAVTQDEGWYSPNQLKSSLNSLSSSLSKIQNKTANIVSEPKIRFEELNRELERYNRLVKEVHIGDEFKDSHYTTIDNLSKGLQRIAENYEQGVYSEKEFTQSLNEQAKAIEKNIRLLEQQESLIKTSGGKKQSSKITFPELKEKIGRITQFDIPEAEIQSLNKAMVELNRLQNQGLSTGERYNQLLNRTNQQYNKLTRSSVDVEYGFKKVNQSMTLKTDATNVFKKLQNDITNLKRTLNNFGAIQFQTPLNQLRELDTSLQLMREHVNEGKLSWEHYREILGLISKEFNVINRESLSAIAGFDKFNNGIRKGESSLSGFTGKLYKLRGLMISLRTLMSVTGSMMLYDYAFRIFNSIGDTLKAKSEMESQLAINTHAGTRSINRFNHALDQTAQKFQKINKYQLGETVTSIGLEFDLNTEQMEKAIPVIAMVSNEYVRAGRTAEEAALAVKDVLQGEFRRLSMETGVGEEELIEAGWSGDAKDIMSLLDALEKVGKSRHWEAFASKATSLNDVLTITQNRLSETGANIANTFTPIITSSFNTIVEVVDKVVASFSNLNLGTKLVVGAGLIGGLTKVSVLLFAMHKNASLLTVTKNGLIRTLGSLVFKLDQTKIAQEGFWKALTLSKTGLDSYNGGIRNTIKLLAGHVLGLDANIVKQGKFWKALVFAKAELKNEAGVMTNASYAAMSFRDKLLYVTTSLKSNQLEGRKWYQVLKNLLIPSIGGVIKNLVKLGTLLGTVSIGAWLIGAGQEAQRTHDKIKAFHDLIDSGNSKLDEAKNKLQGYQDTMKSIEAKGGNYKKNPYYQIALANAKVQEANIKALNGENGISSFDKYDKAIKKLGQRNIDAAMANRVKVLQSTGYNFNQATEAAANYQSTLEDGMNLEKKAYDAEKKANDESAEHVKQQIEHWKQQGKYKDGAKELVDYANEYLTVAEETNRHWKEFKRGNLQEGLFVLTGKAHEMWIDLMMDQDVARAWENMNKAVSGFVPIAREVVGWLMRLGGELAKVFNFLTGNPITRTMLEIGGVGAVLGIVGKKILDFGSKVKSGWETLKGFKDTLSTVIDKFRKNKDVIDKLPDVGNKDKPKTTELPSPVPDKLPDKDKIGFVDKFKDAIREYGKILGHLAGATLLVVVGLGAIAVVGAEYKAMESQIKDGVTAFSEIWPVLLAVLAPVTAFTVAMEKFELVNKSFSTGNMLKTAGAIAGTLSMAAEAIFMLTPSLLSIAVLGAIEQVQGDNIRRGVEVIKETALIIVPVASAVGVLWGGLSLVATESESWVAMGAGFAMSALAIAGALALVTEAVWGLQAPLGQIANLGEKYKINGDDVKKGVEAIKDTMTALNYLAVIFTDTVIIGFDNIILNAENLISRGDALKNALDTLIKDDGTGILNSLSNFAKKFNEKEFTPIDPEKASQLASSASSLTSIADGVKKLNEAMTHLPSLTDDTSEVDSIMLTNSNTTKKLKGEATTGEDTKNKLDNLLEPIKNIKDFVSKLQSEEYTINTDGLQDKVTAITNVTNIISQLQSATQNLKQTLQNAGDAEYQRAGAKGGDLAAWGNAIWHTSPNGEEGSGGYKSSIGKSLAEMENMVADLFTFNKNIQAKASDFKNDEAAADNFSAFIKTIDSQIQQIKTTIDNAKNGNDGLYEKGKSLGEVIIKGFDDGAKGGAEKAKNVGRNMGANFADGFKFKAHLAVSFTNDEINNIISKINERKPDVGEAGHDLGEAFANNYKIGAGIHSPGFAAQATESEIGYITSYIQNGIDNLPVLANQFGQVISQGMTPAPVELPQMSMPELQDVKPLSEQLLGDENTLQTQLDRISPTLTDIKEKFKVDFTTIKDTVTNSFSSVGENTKETMQSMLKDTTGHISRIKVSWHGLQSALINSAETIRSQVTSKVNKIKTNMGDFWKKINNPTLLISGSAGNPNISGGRRHSSSGGVRSFRLPPIMMSAGLPKLQDKDKLLEYIKCLLSGSKNCYAGGWDYNWTPKIESKYSQWKTHFNKYSIDDYVNVGKFKNSNFPVRGIKQIALDYIKDVIGHTEYDFYYDYHYDPVSALNRGAFNCMDGARLIIALANAFGFGGGSIGHTTWGGIGHGYANIPGLGVLDATAIQKKGSFRAPGVHYAGGGSVTHNHNSKGDVNITIVLEGPLYGEDGFRDKMREVAEEVFNGGLKDIVIG